ncbi:MAG: hypothetical protein UH625_01575 [Muribaculaceae bacterium]|nr:hypothetical protein [Muribaculaceae bacterium]
MNDNQIYSDSLSDLKAGMKALKDCLPQGGVITDREIRDAMQKKSLWLKKFVWGEIITFPLCILLLLGIGAYMHMNLWCIYALIIVGIPDIILDFRTIIVPQKWIQEDSMVELSRKLAAQKLWRKRQTVWESPLVVAWEAWFMYEYLRHLENLIPGSGLRIPDEYFYWVWGMLSVAVMCIVAGIVIYIYRKAQHINDNIIRSIDSFAEGE